MCCRYLFGVDSLFVFTKQICVGFKVMRFACLALFLGVMGCFCSFLVLPLDVYAQERPVSVDSPADVSVDQDQGKNNFRVQARASDADALVSGKYRIKLWGIEALDGSSAFLKLKSRTALDDKIEGKPVSCFIKDRTGDEVLAQCVNANEEDLSLFMIQQGFVSVDRAAVFGTIFERPYIDAENQARQAGRGIWIESTATAEKKLPFDGFFLGGVIVLLLFLVGLMAIALFIMRGFRNVVDVQNQSIDLASRERSIREKEKYIIASMLDAEIRSNKAKIEAYIAIYEEMLADFEDKSTQPKYKRSGDIVQKQPVLNRSVFDGNTDKLDLLGREAASDIIHYYARIKTMPDYETLEPDTSLKKAKETVTNALEGAKKLDQISDVILEDFAVRSLISPII